MIVNTTMQITTVLESRLLRYIDIFDKYRYFSISMYRFFQYRNSLLERTVVIYSQTWKMVLKLAVEKSNGAKLSSPVIYKENSVLQLYIERTHWSCVLTSFNSTKEGETLPLKFKYIVKFLYMRALIQ
jgi:hypothetical protein